MNSRGLHPLSPTTRAARRILASLPDVGANSGQLIDFIPRISPGWLRPTHLLPLIRVFERIDAGEEVRVILNVPPRHGKTETILHAFAWLLRRKPERSIMYVSYASDIAKDKSRSVRDYAARAGVELRKDTRGVGHWMTPLGGGLRATGVAGPITGTGTNLLVIDDPHKDRAEAESVVIRSKVHAWSTSTA